MRNVLFTTCQIGDGGIVSIIKLENGGYDVELDRVSQCGRLGLNARAFTFHNASCLAERIRLEPQNGLGDVSYFPQSERVADVSEAQDAALTEKVARRFAYYIRKYLTADELMEVNVLNDRELAFGVCHSHDFCDANDAMLGAFQDCGPFDVEDEASHKLWNAAWDVAVEYRFWA
jgi:hypothetical protein